MDLGLTGKKALVLGGSRGIGWHTAQLLKTEGCSVGLCARGEADVAKARSQLQNVSSGDVFATTADLTDEASTRNFVRSAIDALGGVDILIHNASGFGVGDSEEDWQRSFQVDIMAGVRSVNEALPDLQASGDGSIVFVGSMASKYHFGRPPGAYGPAKAAMRTYANELAQTYGKDGIRANVISPGAVWFPGGIWDQRKAENPKFYAAVEKGIPLGRLGSAEEIARIIAFTASPAGLWLNATHLVADGGQVAAVD